VFLSLLHHSGSLSVTVLLPFENLFYVPVQGRTSVRRNLLSVLPDFEGIHSCMHALNIICLSVDHITSFFIVKNLSVYNAS